MYTDLFIKYTRHMGGCECGQFPSDQSYVEPSWWLFDVASCQPGSHMLRNPLGCYPNLREAEVAAREVQAARITMRVATL